jgi:glycosyltransferase involved in cell wall biosynthesis
MENTFHRRGAELIARAAQMDDYDLTIFVPCWNEEKNVGCALKEIQTTLAKYPFTYDVVVIDDASTDKSVAVIRNLCLPIPS